MSRYQKMIPFVTYLQVMQPVLTLDVPIRITSEFVMVHTFTTLQISSFQILHSSQSEPVLQLVLPLPSVWVGGLAEYKSRLP